jgi:tape measure domain-containing protein
MANDGFIEFLSPNALAELKQAQALVDSLALKIEQISKFKAPSTPSGVNSASKQIIDDLKAQEAQLKAINDQLIRNEKLKQQVLASEAKQSNATKANIALQEARRKAILAQQQADEKAAKAAERSALANERLNSAYSKLNASRNEAARVLKNLIASETASNAEIRKAQKEFDILNAKVKKADQAVGNFSKNVGNYKNALSGLTQLMSAFGISTGIYLAVDIAKNIFETTKQIQSLDLALRNVSGNQVLFAENQIFIKKTSEDFGIEIKGLQEQFTQFYVAAKDKLSGQQIQNIFRSISKAGAAMGLSVESQNSAFLALQQMMSKGTVQAEELKKQLGNALPGAFNIMATALGVTEKKMMEMMKTGSILSEVALPKFAVALEKAYGIENVERVETMVAAQERLVNSWTNLIRLMTEGDGIISRVATGSITLLTERLESAHLTLKFLEFQWKKVFGGDSATDSKNKQVNYAIADYKNLSKELNIAIENRDKELKKLNQLEKIQEKVSGNRKTEAEQDVKISKIRLENLEGIIKIEEKALSTTKAEKLLEVNKKIADQEERYALLTQKSLKIKELRDTKEQGSGEWNRLNNQIILNNEKVELNNKLLDYNYALRYKLTETENKQRTPPTIDEDGKAKKQKERIRLNFDEVESLYNLRIARLKEQQVLQKEIMNNQDAPDYTRLEARKEFSRLEVQILDEQYKKEQALALQNLTDSLAKAEQQYRKNIENGFNDVKNNEEFAKAKNDIQNKYLNETELANINHSRAWQNLMYEDADFNEKIRKATFDKEEKLRKQTIKDINDLNDAIVKSEQEKQLKISNNEKLTLKTRQSAFQEYQHQALLQLQIDKQRETTGKETVKQLELLDFKYDKLAEAITGLESPLDVANEKMKDFLRNSAFDTISKGLDSLGLSSLKVFTDIDRNGQSTFVKLFEAAETSKEQFAVAFQVIGDVFQDVMNMMMEASNRRFAAEKQKLQEETEIALAFAGDSDSARAEIERQAEKRRKEIAAREFKAKKKQAIFNIAIDTAQAIISIWAQVPKVDFGVSAGLLSAFVGALGAAQIAMVQSQEVPAFKDGGVHDGGLMLVNDAKGSNFRETIKTPDGKLYQPKGRNVLMNAPKGTEIFTPDQWQKNLDSMLMSNNISYAQPNINVNGGGITDAQVNKIVSTIQNKQEYHQTFDRNGIKNYISNGHTQKEILNNQVTFGR